MSREPSLGELIGSGSYAFRIPPPIDPYRYRCSHINCNEIGHSQSTLCKKHYLDDRWQRYIERKSKKFP